MNSTTYHSNLSSWMRMLILDLVNDVPEELLWKRFQDFNTPGWVIAHLIAEAEEAILKLQPDYTRALKNSTDFLYGSDGNASVDVSTAQLLRMFHKTYQKLDSIVNEQFDTLRIAKNEDELLNDLLPVSIDFYLHLLTTHLAMHIEGLRRWRITAGLPIL